jgi:tetratricopeptide (TPR) repeat protein
VIGSSGEGRGAGASRHPVRRATIDAHRNHRGPTTAGGQLARRLIERAGASARALVASHPITLLSVAPEIAGRVTVDDRVLRSFAFSREGNPRSWTRRLAHGLADFVLACRDELGRRSVLGLDFDHVEAADPADQELIAVLLRRVDPGRILLRVRTASAELAAPLTSALEAHARAISRQPGALPSPERVARALDRLPPAERRRLAQGYVRSDCTSDDPLARAAYDRLGPEERRELHRRQARRLARSKEPTLALGAIPFHEEQAGGDPATLSSASSQCMRMACYDAALDWARRGRRMLGGGRDDGGAHAAFTRDMIFALLLLGRHPEVEALCAESQARSRDPALLSHAAYAMAILNARLYAPARRDYAAARTWVERALAFTAMLPPSPSRVVNLAFLKNTLALVEMRQGRHAEAERLLAAALEELARDAPEKFAVECPIFLHNRARLHQAMGRPEEAMDDLTALLSYEPSSSEAYLDRGVIHQRAGRHREALRDYANAVAWSPPYTEPHFNRGQTLVALGRHDEARAEYDRVILLEPDHVGARVDRGAILHRLGDLAAARIDVGHALSLEPRNARALCLRGVLELERGRLDAADRAFVRALAVDPQLADAWANRATVLYRRGDFDGALAHLTRALDLREDPDARYNRGRLQEARQQWRAAADDYQRALELAGSDAEEIQRRLARCRLRCLHLA